MERGAERIIRMNTYIQTIGFKTGPPRSPNGNPLPTGSDIPKMRGRTKSTLSTEINHLTNALELLSDVPCSFWACRGATVPLHMITCIKCSAMREIAGVRSTLILEKEGEQGRLF